MALINCPECQKEVSDTALACPHCGFGVASYIQESKRIQQELAEDKEKQKQRQQNLERWQKVTQTIKSKFNKIIETQKSKPKLLNQYGKKSFWILAALLPYSVIATALPYINDYFVRKHIGLLSANDNIINWFARNVWPIIIPVLVPVLFIHFFVPWIFYIIANNVKSIKTAKVFLVLGLIYNILLFMLAVVSNIINIIRFSIPLCVYLILFYKATHIKK